MSGDSIDYRAGDFAAFRHALLRPLPDERALRGWHPTARGDLALQLLEWWAYLADILAFYNERALNEVLLRTAAVPADVRRIVRLLGYRPRPGIGATGVVAARTASPHPFAIPAGFAIEGATSSPEDPAQVFESDETVAIGQLRTQLLPSAGFPRPPRPAQWTGRTPKAPNGNSLSGLAAVKGAEPGLSVVAGQELTLALDGVIASVAPDDVIMIIKRDWLGHLLQPFGYVLTLVRKVESIFDDAGRPFTQLTLLPGTSLPAGARRDDYRIVRPTKQAHLWLYHQRYPGSSNPMLIGGSQVLQVIERIFDPGGIFTSGAPPRPPEDPRVITGVQAFSPGLPHGVAHLEAVVRGLNPGDPVLFEKRAGGGLLGWFRRVIETNLPPEVLLPLRMIVAQLVRVDGYAEDIWYANMPEADRVGQGPPVGAPSHSLVGGLAGAEGPIPIPHSRITFAPNPFLDVMAVGDLDLDKIVVHYDWQEFGTVVDPHDQAEDKVTVPAIPGVPPEVAVPALVVDATGRGTRAWTNTTTTVEGDPLVGAVEALLDLVPVSRGQTVRGEVLGSGDPTAIYQELPLLCAPLTYLPDFDPTSVTGYRSTLRVRVDGIEWYEVPSFYGQPAGARVFVTREDDDHRTHVRFGDGVHGARLPAGRDNVVADYRYGSGAKLPRPGTLTTILRPQPGVESIVNPVPVGGGADPDPPEQIRRYAPRSVLTFQRAISGDDYETLAAQTPGVSRARVYWSWDLEHQRNVVKVYVGDTATAVDAARKALRSFGDPNRAVVVARATAIHPKLEATLEVAPAYDPAAVQAAVTSALLDPQRAPFGSEVIRIGDAVYDSQIYDACLRVPGVVAVHHLRFSLWQPTLVAAQLVADLPLQLATAGPPPYFNDAVFDGFFGPRFLPSELFRPQILADRLHIGLDVLRDPFKLVGKLVPNPSQPQPQPGSTTTTVDDGYRVDPGPRHDPGEGSLFMLRGDLLHLTAEHTLDVI